MRYSEDHNVETLAMYLVLDTGSIGIAVCPCYTGVTAALGNCISNVHAGLGFNNVVTKHVVVVCPLQALQYILALSVGPVAVVGRQRSCIPVHLPQPIHQRLWPAAFEPLAPSPSLVPALSPFLAL